MGRIVVSQFITVDGVIEDPGGAEGFEHGGWAFSFERGDEGDRFKFEEVMASDALLLGRRTYEGFAEAWPSRTGDFADKFNSMPKYVVSENLNDPEWTNTIVLGGGAAGAAATVKERHERDILVNGSARLTRALLAAGAVDELRLMVFPIVLGAGKRLFGAHESPVPLRLTESRPAGETLILRFVPASSAS
jgi:dihydrofolate reductase